MSPSPSDSAPTPTVAAGEVIRVSAVVLARPDRRVLTVRKAGTAMFMFPGGKHLPGEAPVDTAVREVAAGGTLLEEIPVAQPRPRPPTAAGGDRIGLLTDQERIVLQLIGEGLTNRQIGGRMGLAEKTVKNYTSHLLAKLGLERRTQAAILATQLRDLADG